jgi:archaetidylinositol phosphate synthase
MIPGHRGVERAERSNSGILEPFETPALRWLAARTPNWVTPNILTAIGFLGALGVFASYALSGGCPALLWLASVGLFINWLGDSLDGSLARFRAIERPRYGFYLDNAIDVPEQLLLALGLALSGIFRVELALLGLIAFYMMSILTLIRAKTVGEFTLAYVGLGTTELRLLIAVINTLVFFFPPKPFSILGASTTYPNVLSAVWIGATFMTFLISMIEDLRKLAVEDPPHSPAPVGCLDDRAKPVVMKRP